MIVEPPSMGSTTDEHGHSRPVAFMQYRINGYVYIQGVPTSLGYAKISVLKLRKFCEHDVTGT